MLARGVSVMIIHILQYCYQIVAPAPPHTGPTAVQFRNFSVAAKPEQQNTAAPMATAKAMQSVAVNSGNTSTS